MKKPRDVFLDFDDTITCIDTEPYFDEYLGINCHRQIVKNNVNEFLKFLTDNFNVVWCSYNSENNIHKRLQELVDEEIISKIPYFDCIKYGFNNKVIEINEVSQDYIFIDDSYCKDEQEMILENCYFVQACETDINDLIRIEDEIRYKFDLLN